MSEQSDEAMRFVKNTGQLLSSDVKIGELLSSGMSPQGRDHMTREELQEYHEALCNEARELMRRKNEDYACAEDPFRNFRMFGRLGILVRMSDKLARLRTFTERGTLSVKDESVRDAIVDLINYAVLFGAYDE